MGTPADNQEPRLQKPKTRLDMLGDISKAVGYRLAFLVLDQPKHLGEMAVNTGIKDSHGDGSSTKELSPSCWLVLDNKGNN